MALSNDFDSILAHSFGLEIDGILIKAITEVSGLTMEQDVVESKQNTADGKYVVKKLPGRRKETNDVVLTRPLTADRSFSDWVKSAPSGKMSDARKGGAIIVYDYEGNAILRYNMPNAWPKKLEVGNLQARGTPVLTEKLTITHEGLEPTT